MILVVPREISHRLRAELRRARCVEIGGLLFGEHLSDDTFRIADFTVQRTGGTRVHFVRNPEQHASQLASFFDRSGRDYTRFNYLGEWHSHPSFPPTPSSLDLIEMSRLIKNGAVGASFLSSYSSCGFGYSGYWSERPRSSFAITARCRSSWSGTGAVGARFRDSRVVRLKEQRSRIAGDE